MIDLPDSFLSLREQREMRFDDPKSHCDLEQPWFIRTAKVSRGNGEHSACNIVLRYCVRGWRHTHRKRNCLGFLEWNKFKAIPGSGKLPRGNPACLGRCFSRVVFRAV